MAYQGVQGPSPCRPFSAIALPGQLPVTVSDRYPRGFGLRTAAGTRLRYASRR
jgi:hypothetical protein